MKKLACILALIAAAGITASFPILGADKAPTTKPGHHQHGTTQPTSKPASQPSTQQAKDAGNTKCLLMPEDDITEGVTATYKGVTYHFCCKACIKPFNKDPEKYIKALAADPAKYGVKK